MNVRLACPACGSPTFWHDLLSDVVNGYLFEIDSGDSSHFERAIQAADAALRDEEGEDVSGFEYTSQSPFPVRRTPRSHG